MRRNLKLEKRKNSNRALAAAAMATVSCLASHAQADRTWTGTTGNWTLATNWSGNATPIIGTDNAVVTNGGTIQVNAGDNVGGKEIWVGNTGGSGNVIQSGGNVTSTSWFVVGRIGGTGNYTLSGGNLTTNTTDSGSRFIIGDTGGVGTFTMSGTSVLSTTNDEIWLGQAGGNGTFVMNGGNVTTNNWVAIGRGSGSTGNLTINAGTFTHLANSGDFEVGSGGSTTATLNLNGGTLNTNFIRDESSGGTQIINFNGGTLQANATDTGFIGGHGTFTRINVRNGGAIIDTNGLTIGITQALLHSNLGDNAIDGGLTKLGNTTLTLSGASTYTGNTTISAGTLTAGVASVVASGNATSGAFGIKSAVSLGNISGVTLNLNNFSQQIGSLAGGGTLGGNVTLGNATLTTGEDGTSTIYSGAISGTGGLTKIGSGVLTLAGPSSYSGGTTVSAGTIKVGDNSALGNGTLTFAGASTLQAAGNVTLSNTVAIGTTNDTFDTNGFTLGLSGGVTNTGTGIPVRVIGAGTLNLSGTFNLSGNANDTNSPALYMNVSGTTTTLSGNGSLTGISMAWSGTKNTLNFSSAGTINLTNSTDSALDVGQGNANAAGVVNQTSGTVNVSSNVALGRSGRVLRQLQFVRRDPQHRKPRRRRLRRRRGIIRR